MEVTVAVMEDMVVMVMDVKGDLPKPTTDMVDTEAVMEVMVADMAAMVDTDTAVNSLFSIKPTDTKIQPVFFYIKLHVASH